MTTTTTATRAAAISSLLIAAFWKLERYNDIINGQFNYDLKNTIVVFPASDPNN